MRRAYSSARLAAERSEALRCVGDMSAARLVARASFSSLHKDPSLGTLLLGEVAEVC